MKEISKKQVAYGVASATVGLMSAGSVFAADGNTWTGLNVYGGIGYNTLSSKENTFMDSDQDNPAFFSGTHSKSKLSGQVGAGYDAQINNQLVLGVFAEYSFAGPKTEMSAVGYNGNYTYDTSTKVKDAMSLGLKLGMPLGANDLLFVSGGVSRAKIEVKSREVGYNSNYYFANKKDNKTGAFIGLGLEHQVSDKLSIVADYRYTNFGSVKVQNVNYNSVYYIDHKAKVTTQNLSLNLKFKF
jgi:outer membrane immunogenic protein